jgi:pantetheine-phosphate adenylyltransferase
VNNERVAIVTGSFDPITVGHVGIVRRAAAEFDRVYVVALSNAEKQHTFTSDARREMIRLAVADVPNAVADAYEGMTADYMHDHGITTIVRGIRSEEDRAYEEYLASCMRALDPSFTTVWLAPDPGTESISSTLVRDALREGRPITGLVPPAVETYIKSTVNS